MVREAAWVKESFRNLILWNSEGTCKVQTGLKDCSLISEGGKAVGVGVVTRESIDFWMVPSRLVFLTALDFLGSQEGYKRIFGHVKSFVEHHQLPQEREKRLLR